MKVTSVSAQIGPEGLAETVTDGVKFGFTVIVMPLEVAVEEETQISAEGVMTTVTTSLFFKPEVVNVMLVAPATDVAFVFHW